MAEQNGEGSEPTAEELIANIVNADKSDVLYEEPESEEEEEISDAGADAEEEKEQEEPEKEELFLGKFKTREEAEKSLKEGEKKITQQGQENAELRKRLEELESHAQRLDELRRVSGAENEDQEAKLLEDQTRQIENPRAFGEEIAREAFRKERQNEINYKSFINDTVSEAETQLFDEREGLSEIMTDEMWEEAKGILRNDPALSRMTAAITEDNWKQIAKPDVINHMKATFSLAINSVLANNTEKLISEAKTKAAKEAEREMLEKKGLVLQKPGSKRPIRGGKMGQDLQAELKNKILSAQL